MNTAAWPELERLVRLVRATDSMTDLLTAWTGRIVSTEVLSISHESVITAAEAAALDAFLGAEVQRRRVLLRAGDAVVAEAWSAVLIGSVALPPRTRLALRDGASLGNALKPLGRRRVTTGAPDILRLSSGPTGDWDQHVLEVHSRLDVGGIPVAVVREFIFEAVFADMKFPEPRTAKPGLTSVTNDADGASVVPNLIPQPEVAS